MEKIKVFKCENCGYEDGSEFYEPYKNVLPDGKISCPKCHKKVNYITFDYEIGKKMTMQEYVDLVEYINKHHNFPYNGKMIKYANSSIDFRNGLIWKVSLNDVDFSVVNKNRHKNLKEWIYDWLEKEECLEVE
jgi:hypothetical protein